MLSLGADEVLKHRNVVVVVVVAAAAAAAATVVVAVVVAVVVVAVVLALHCISLLGLSERVSLCLNSIVNQ